MAVAFPSSTEATSADAGGAGNATANVNPPTGLTAGDTWWLVVVLDRNDTGTTINTPSGFTAAHNELTGADDAGFPAVRTFWKTAGASETAVTVDTSGGGAWIMWVSSIRSSTSNTTNPVGNVQTTTPTGADDVVDAPDVTIQNDGSGVILIGAQTGDMEGVTPPAGTTLLESRSANGEFPGGAVAVATADAGTFSPGNWTFGNQNQDNRIAITIEVLPASAGAAPPPTERADGFGLLAVPDYGFGVI